MHCLNVGDEIFTGNISINIVKFDPQLIQFITVRGDEIFIGNILRNIIKFYPQLF